MTSRYVTTPLDRYKATKAPKVETHTGREFDAFMTRKLNELHAVFAVPVELIAVDGKPVARTNTVPVR